MIASDDTSGENITFAEAMQTVSPASSDDFISGDLIENTEIYLSCLLYTSPSPRDRQQGRMPSSA